MKNLIKELPRWMYWYPFRIVAEKIPLPYTYPMVKLTARVGTFVPQNKFPKINDGLRKSFPDKSSNEIRQLVHKTFENYLLNACEAFWYPKLNRSRMLQLVDYEGLEKIDAALKLGKGVILAHGHFGNEELLMPAIGYMGYKTHQLGSRWEPPQHDGSFSDIVNFIRRKAFEKRIRYRESFPVNFHYVDKNLRPALRCLQENEVLLFAVDGREGSKWLTMNFLGRKARFSPGVIKIAQATGAVILPVFITRLSDCRHRLVIHEPLPVPTGDGVASLQGFLALLESYIRKNPEQYSKVFFLVNDFFID